MRATAMQQKRTMAGGPKPVWTGIDKTVRGYFPEDWQLAAAILGGYSSLIVVAQIRSAMKGKPPVVVEAPKAVVAVTSTGIPDVNSPEFAEYLDSEAFIILLENDEQLAAVVDDL